MIGCYFTFCESGFQGSGLQRLVDKLHPDFECERSICSPFSPGVVRGDEEIIFLLVNGTHYDEVRGELAPVAFQELYKRDLSVLRKSHLTATQLSLTIEQLVERGSRKTPPVHRKVEFACSVIVDDLRAIVVNGAQKYAVYDTALPDKTAHASIFPRASIIGIKPAQSQARADMLNVFKNNVFRIDELYSTLP